MHAYVDGQTLGELNLEPIQGFPNRWCLYLGHLTIHGTLSEFQELADRLHQMIPQEKPIPATEQEMEQARQDSWRAIEAMEWAMARAEELEPMEEEDHAGARRMGA